MVTVDEAKAAVTTAQTMFNGARKSLASLLEERKPLVIAAGSDGEASAALRDNRDAVIAAELALVDAETRLTAARAELAEAERQIKAVQDATKFAEAESIFEQLLRESAAFDQHLAEAAAALQRRENLRVQLGATGCARQAAVDALGDRWRVLAAFEVGGLGRYVDLIHTPGLMSLAASDRQAISLHKPTTNGAAA
jgi:hypothetical protein